MVVLETPPLAARLPTPTNAAVRANHTQLQLKAIRQHPAERREQSMLVRLRCSACSLSARAAGARSTASRGPQFLGRGAAAGQVAPGRAADVRLLSTAPDDADTRLAAVLKDIQSKIQAAAPENDPVEGTKTRGPKMVLRFTCTCADCVENIADEAERTSTKTISKHSYENGTNPSATFPRTCCFSRSPSHSHRCRVGEVCQR